MSSFPALRLIQPLDSFGVLDALMFGVLASNFQCAVESLLAVVTARVACTQVAPEKIALKPDGCLLTVDDRIDLDFLQAINFSKACDEGITLRCGERDSVEFELAAGDFQFEVLAVNLALEMDNAMERFRSGDKGCQILC